MNNTAQNTQVIETSHEIQVQNLEGWELWMYCDEEVLDTLLADYRKYYPRFTFRAVKTEKVQTVLDR